MAANYFWVDGEVVIINPMLYGDDPDFPKHLIHKLCIDTHHTNESHRYGVFTAIRGEGIEWRHKPLETFPPEFRANLLLLGVT